MEIILKYGVNVCVPRQIVEVILDFAHDCKISAHFSYYKTINRLVAFHWIGKAKYVEAYSAGCLICQKSMHSRTKPLWEPQPLELQYRRWGSVSANLIIHLPLTKRECSAIAIFVDRFSKWIYFVLTQTSDFAENVTFALFKCLFWLHDLPNSINFNRDPKFTSSFLLQHMKLCGNGLKMSTSRHHQTDDSTISWIER